jgi:hypothetical protein
MSTRPSVRPVLLLEINEVPWRVLDRAVADGRFAATRRFFTAARTHTTVARDVGELSPWITWPSLHRGMSNTEHGVHHLGQDVGTFRGTPLWDEYRARGLSVGVCGSLQSWPPRDPGPGGFYVPDTFAHDARCIPRYLEPLQRFNLGLVGRNGLVVRDEAPLGPRDALALLPALARVGLRPRTYGRLAAQLLAERRDKARLARRPVFQAVVFWDVFRHLYDPAAPPALATFFTNHVAGVMHRYWSDVFPEDFPDRPAGAPRPHAATMDFALAVLDDILADALAFQARNPDLVLAFATSMGQAAVHRDGHEGFGAAVTDLPALLAAFDVPAGASTTLLAMVPQVAADVPDAAVRARLRAALEAARTAAGAPVFRVDAAGTSLSITVLTPRRADKDRGGFWRRDAGAPDRFVAWADGGVTLHPIAAGTAYHVPEGALALVGRGIAPRDTRERLEAAAVKGLLMDLAGLAPARPTTEPVAAAG